MTINYKTTVNLANRTLYLQVTGILPEAVWDQQIRLQAVFSQRKTRRIFPMKVEILEEDMDRLFTATAKIRLPYVFRVPPKHDVTLTWIFWAGSEEVVLDDQPFPVNKDQFSIRDYGRKKSRLKYGIYTAMMPAMLLGNYLSCGRNTEAAKKKTNAVVYRGSGYSYSPRQRNTDYFAARYRKEVDRNPKLEGNKVLFLSERLPEEGGNLLCLMEELRKDPDIEILEFIHTRTVDKLKKKELNECARKCAQARVIILEDFYPQLHSIHKRPETRIVQLWHACGAFKTFGYSRLGKRGGAPQSSMNHRNYDLVPVSSPVITDIYAEAFAINPDNVKPLGVPRTDVLFDDRYKEAKREELYRKYPRLRGCRVVLFAPTFRGDGNKDAYYPAEAFDPEAFLSGLPEDIILIVKHHPFVASPVGELPEDGRILDLTGKDHINDLLLLTDLLITDYSSSIFEAALLEVPMLFYAFDEENYIRTRDCYFGYRGFVPGMIAADQEELARDAAGLLSGGMSYDAKGFVRDFLGSADGNSTLRIADYIRDNYLL